MTKKYRVCYVKQMRTFQEKCNIRLDLQADKEPIIKEHSETIDTPLPQEGFRISDIVFNIRFCLSLSKNEVTSKLFVEETNFEICALTGNARLQKTRTPLLA